MFEFIRENWNYIGMLISFFIGYLVGRDNGKVKAQEMFFTRQMRIEAEKAQSEMMTEMMRGFKNGN